MLRGVDRILFRVENLAAAVEHYQKRLGLNLLRRARNTAVFSLGESGVELVLHDDSDLPGEATYLLVDDLRAMYDRRDELNLRFAGVPVPTARGYRATARDPFGAMLLLVDRSNENAKQSLPTTETGLFPGTPPRLRIQRSALIQAYVRIGRTADDLPYSAQFEALFEAYAGEFPDPKPDHAEVWRHLLTIRKSGKLPKLGAATSRPPELTAQERARLKAILGTDIGRRDRLPYTERFNEVFETYNSRARVRLSPHHLWRAVAMLAK